MTHTVDTRCLEYLPNHGIFQANLTTLGLGRKFPRTFKLRSCKTGGVREFKVGYVDRNDDDKIRYVEYHDSTGWSQLLVRLWAA